MFVLRDFLMKMLLGGIGIEPDFKIRQNGANWYGRGELTEGDLAEIDAAIEARNALMVEEQGGRNNEDISRPRT